MTINSRPTDTGLIEPGGFRADEEGIGQQDRKVALIGSSARRTLSRVQSHASKLFFRPKTPVRPERNQLVASSGGSGRLLVTTFSLFVLLPALFAFIYYATIASPVYVTEVKLTVREAARGDGRSLAQSILGSIRLGPSSQGTGQDTLMVLDYLKSRAVIQDLGGVGTLAGWYGKPDIDWFSRLESSANLEQSWDYWKTHVTASVDTISNILTMRVRAYTPQDSLDVSQRLVENSEKLVNEISGRRRADALSRAIAEVEKAGAELANVRTAMLEFQKRSGNLDPLETAKVIIGNIATLTAKKIEIETRLATATTTGVGGRPGERYDQARLAAVDEQLGFLNESLTGDGRNSVSSQLKEYEIIRLKEEFAEKIYTLARTGYEDARKEVEKKQRYVALVVPGVLPDSPLYPQVFTDSGLVGLGCLVVWAIVSLIAATLRDSLV